MDRGRRCLAILENIPQLTRVGPPLGLQTDNRELKCKNLSLRHCKEAGAGDGSVEETKAGPVNRRHHRPGPLFRERRQAN